MSRIGRQPITIPAGVTVAIDGQHVTVRGPKGEHAIMVLPGIAIAQVDATLVVSLTAETAETQAAYGLMRTLVNNLVLGVSAGFERQLEINGVGYRAAVAGNIVTLNLGFSHPVVFTLPEGVAAAIDRNVLTISGSDKQAVGQVAADIRALKKPEPYKGKGIKYVEERIRRKAGKTAAKG